MLVFAEVEDGVKNVAVKVITFLIGIAIFTMAWGLLVDGIQLIIKSFGDIVGVLNNFTNEPINTASLYRYILTPVGSITKIADNVVSYLIIFAKFGFIISVLTNKAAKENFVTKKINEYVTNAIDFVKAKSQI